MDLTIPMGWRDHSKEDVEMVKGQQDKYAQTKKLLKYAQKWYKNVQIKHEGMWSLKWGNICGWTLGILKCLMDWPYVSLPNMQSFMKFCISRILMCTP